MSEWRNRAKPLTPGLDLSTYDPTSPETGYTAPPMPIKPFDMTLTDEGGVPVDVAPPASWRERAKPLEAPKVKAAAPVQKQGLIRTAFDQGMQGATYGFADEVSDPLGAVIATAVRNPRALINPDAMDENLAFALVNARKDTQEKLKQEMTQNPATSIASNIAGGLATGVSGATTKIGSSVGNLIRSGNVGSRLIKGALAGAASGAVYGAGAGDDGERADSAKRGAILGGALGTAAPIAGYLAGGIKNSAKGLSARSGEALNESLQALKDKSTQSYQAMRANGATFNNTASSRILNDIKTALNSDGKLNPSLHDKTLAAFGDIQKELKAGNLTLEGLDQWRQVLGDVAGNIGDKVNARKATILIKAIDDSVDKISPNDLSNGSRAAIDSLQAARKQWSTARKFEMVSDVVKKADGDPNKLKSGLRSLLNNKKAVRGLTPAEYKSLENAARYTTGEGLTKALGKFGFDLGTSQTMGNTALPVLSGLATGATTGAATGGAVPIIGTAARATQKLLAKGKAEELLKVIEQGGTVPTKQIMALPPEQAKKLLAAIRQTQSSAARAAIAAQE